MLTVILAVWAAVRLTSDKASRATISYHPHSPRRADMAPLGAISVGNPAVVRDTMPHAGPSQPMTSPFSWK